MLENVRFFSLGQVLFKIAGHSNALVTEQERLKNYYPYLDIKI